MLLLSRNLNNCCSSLSKPVLDEKFVSFPLAQPSLPKIDALAPVGTDIGISLLMTFQIADEFI